jgi:hypothetical protein
LKVRIFPESLNNEGVTKVAPFFCALWWGQVVGF